MSTTRTDRRSLLSWLGASVAVPALIGCDSTAEARAFPVNYSEAEWKKRLTSEQFFILREKGTERPFTSPLLKEARKGQFACAADGNVLFSSSTKYDSKTGWPSFWDVAPRATKTSTDFDTGYPRTEIHCARCGGHLGHIFNDGPKPTGKRYCINGDAMIFVPQK